MITITQSQVIFNNPVIVKYFTKYQNNAVFLNSCEHTLEMFCKSAEDFILQYSKEQKYDTQTSTIMLQLETLERKQDEFKASFHTIADDIVNKVTCQLSSLIISIENIISSQASKLNTDGLKDFIANTFDATNEQCQKQLQEHIKSHILSPIQEAQEALMEKFARLPELLSQSSNIDVYEQKLQSMNSKWMAVIDTIVVDIKQLHDNVESHAKFSNDSVRNSPFIIKGVLGDLVHNLEKQSSNIAYIVDSIQKDIASNTMNLVLIKSTNDDLKSQVASLDKQLLTKQTKESNSNSFKGTLAEETLYNLLCEKLMTREGFSISKVNGISHSCDILVRKTDRPDIRIESKAHGQYTGEKVRTREIEKFERDLLELNNHGIFVSVYSDITGKGSVEIKQLLETSKFAIYLSKNMYDCDMISDMIYLLYNLDKITSTSSNSNMSNTTLSPEIISKIQNIIKSFAGKLTNVKTSLKDALALLNTITMEQINMLIFDQNKPVTPSLAPLSRQCELCLYVFKNDRGLKEHRRRNTCKKATVVVCCNE